MLPSWSVNKKMGWTTGRRLTSDVLEKIAKQYVSRGEFQKNDSSAYVTARKMGILDIITKHMSNVSFSIPQLLCRQILDGVLEKHSLYNTRKIITPYEIDIFYPELNLAVEYNGKGWHNTPDAVRRDFNKRALLKEKNIMFIECHENSRKYEIDIKSQLATNAILTNVFNVLPDDIMKYRVNWDKIYAQTTVTDKVKQIRFITDNCESLKEFRTKFKSHYNFVIKNKMGDILAGLPRALEEYSENELLKKAGEFLEYCDFVKSKYYNLCHRRGIMEKATSHMIKTHNDWKSKTDNEILKIYEMTGSTCASDVRNKHSALYNVMKKRNLRPWPRRISKYDPIDIKQRIESLLDSGVKYKELKTKYIAIYGAYIHFKKKGYYVQTEKS